MREVSGAAARALALAAAAGLAFFCDEMSSKTGIRKSPCRRRQKRFRAPLIACCSSAASLRNVRNTDAAYYKAHTQKHEHCILRHRRSTRVTKCTSPSQKSKPLRCNGFREKNALGKPPKTNAYYTAKTNTRRGRTGCVCYIVQRMYHLCMSFLKKKTYRDRGLYFM